MVTTILLPRTASTSLDNLPEHLNRTSTWANHAWQGANGRGFTRSVQTEKTVNLSLPHTQADRINGSQTAEGLG
jgi:hypothetical protein